MSLSPGTRLAQYEIVGLIGAGGMGEVYRARDARLDRDVAIKMLPDHPADDAEMRGTSSSKSAAASGCSWTPNQCSIRCVRILASSRRFAV